MLQGLSGRIQDMIRLRNPSKLKVVVLLIIAKQNVLLAQKKITSYRIDLNPNVSKPANENVAQHPSNFNKPK